MKVILISDFYPPQVGGMEQHVATLAKQLVAQGHDVHVVTSGAEDCEEVVQGIAVQRLAGLAQHLTFAFTNTARRFPPPLTDHPFARKFRQFAHRIKPDVLHVHGWTSYSVIAANRNLGIPLVMTLHDYGHFCPKRTVIDPAQKTCESGFGLRCLPCTRSHYGMAKGVVTSVGVGIGRRALQTVDQFIAVSDYVRDRSLPYLPQDRVITIPNFLDPAKFQAEHAAGSDSVLPEKFILAVGALTSLKGIGFLMETYRQARQDSAVLKTIPLLILGPEMPGENYQSDEENGIFVYRNPPRDQVVKAIWTCTALVVPSIWQDPCPTVVLEGVCARKPVVGTQVGGIPTLLRGVPHAALVPMGDRAACVRALNQAVEKDTAVVAKDIDDWLAHENYLPLDPALVTRRVVEVYQAARERNRSH